MQSQVNRYDDRFFDFIDEGAVRSAGIVIDHVKELVSVGSVVEFGCGRGAWLHAWKQMGVDTVVGVDLDCVDTNRLMIDRESFFSHDLSTPIDLGRRFDLVQSLEVAEHIDAAHADTFIDNLERHGDVILFSAALPGQGGIQHVNEQPSSYWRDRFSRRGFLLLDPIRRKILHQKEVSWWYRHGIFFFVRDSVFPTLPQSLQSTVIPSNERIPDYSPLSMKLRRAAMRCLPRVVTEWLARIYMGR